MLATLPLLIAPAILLTGVVLMIRGVIDVRRSARLARAGQLGQQATGVVSIIVGAVLVGAMLALAVFVLMSLGSVLDN